MKWTGIPIYNGALDGRGGTINARWDKSDARFDPDISGSMPKSAITLANSDNNLKSFKARIDTKVKEIEAIERTPYNKRGLEKKYFDEVGKWQQHEFIHEFLTQKSAWRSGRSLLDVHLNLAPYVGCRRVVFVPNWRHSVSCRAEMDEC